MPTYRIVRFFQREDRRRLVLRTGLTKEEAQAHCRDPQTASHTCTESGRKAYTKAHGPWIDGFEEER